uniref:VHS domain-containing protein n=1 Tax=Haemonchus contortus TaxID=6289 RepID=A0A7I5EAB3_HAECO
MLRRVFRSSAGLSQAVLRVTVTRTLAANVAAVEGDDPLKGLIDALSSENEISSVSERIKSPFTDVASFKELKKRVESHKEPLSPAEYLGVLKSTLFLDKDKKMGPAFVKSCGKGLNEEDIAAMDVNDEFVAIMTALLDLGLKDEATFREMEKRLLSLISETELSITAVVPLIIACNRVGYTWPKELKAAVKEALTSQIRDIDNANILIAVLTHWDPSDREVSQAAADKTAQLLGTDLSCCVLTIGEMCSLMSRFAERGIRDKRLLPLLSARITDHRTPLSVRQLVSLAASCAKLHYFDGRVQRRLVKDLLVDVNNLQNWSDVSSLVNSFSRLRFGAMPAWNALATWVNNNVDDAPLESLSIVIAGMARNGVEECRPAALKLAERVRRESAPSQNAWLSTVHALAYFRVLTPDLAETVLNRDFVNQLLQATTSPGDKLFKAMKLLQISACTRVDLGKSYTGPIVDLSNLSSFIKFDDETTRLARLNKYGKKELETCNHFLADVVFKMGSPSTHIGPSCIDNDGVLFDARIVCEKESNRLVAINKWGESVPRPIIFFAWGQTRQLISDVVPTEANALLGWDQLSLRLLRARGVKPIVVLHSELSAFTSLADKLQFLKKRIADTA